MDQMADARPCNAAHRVKGGYLPTRRRRYTVTIAGYRRRVREESAIRAEPGEATVWITLPGLLRSAREVDGDRLWPIEDCRQRVGQLERFVWVRGKRVVRVPPHLMAGRCRELRQPERAIRSTCSPSKTRDPFDPERSGPGREREPRHERGHGLGRRA